MSTPEPLLRVDGLRLGLRGVPSAMPIVENADITIAAGEVHALVGESGSGKTMLARSLMRLLPDAVQYEAGRILFDGRDLTALPDSDIRRLRGAEIGMIFQEPLVSLNPALTIGRQLAEALILHKGWEASRIRKASIEMLSRVRITDPEGTLARYPHEFSGGMRQRIMLASILLLKPRLIIADEPTTALDAIIKRSVLDLMVHLVREEGTAVLLVSHDLGLVANYAERVTVMHKGQIVETGRAADVLRTPAHAYTRDLLESLPRRGVRPPLTVKPLLEADSLNVTFHSGWSLFGVQGKATHAVCDASFQLGVGETLAVVGESGSGKTTLGRAILQLARGECRGAIRLDGRDLAKLSRKSLRTMRRDMQIIFQDPSSSLDPRKNVGSLIGEGLRLCGKLAPKERRDRIAAVLDDVDLSSDFATRFPHELSGGQRQRVSIARAIVMRPRLIIADEPTSALDVTVQARVLELISRLQAQYGFSALFITHDLGVVEQVADRVLVMYRGRIVEAGPRDAIFDNPQHPYTARLLNAVPRLQKTSVGYTIGFAEPAAVLPPAGYRWFNDGSLGTYPVTPGEARMVEISANHHVAVSRHD